MTKEIFRDITGKKGKVYWSEIILILKFSKLVLSFSYRPKVP